MKTTFHVYGRDNYPVSHNLVNIDEDQLLQKIKERRIDFNEHEVLRVEQDDEGLADASY